MKKTAIISLSLLTALGAFAQARMNAGALQMLSAARDASIPAARSGEFKLVEDGQFSVANFFVTVDDEADFETLRSEGYNIQAVNGDMAIVSLDSQELIALSEHPLVIQITCADEAKALLVDARIATGVDAIHQATDPELPSAFTGKGVIVGMMDVGLDINHVNFLKDVDATGYFTKNPGMDIPNRAERVWWISGKGVVTPYETPEAIAGFTTDESTATHGTHVLGIAAGSFRGRVNAPVYNERGGIDTKPKANPFYGVAYEADLAVAAGSLQGVNINLAIDRIAKYAESVDKPVAMNLSLGHNLGPHDGSTDANKYMSRFADNGNMIICVSAGNEGDLPIAIESEFAAGTPAIRTFISKNGTANGVWDLWAGNSDKFTTSFAVYDKQDNQIVWTHKIDYNKLDQDNRVVLCGTYYNMPTYDIQANIDKYFSIGSSLTFTPVVDPNNNRFNVRVVGNLSPDNTTKNQRYLPALVIEGNSGQKISMYGNNACFYSNGVTGFTEGSTEGSINDMACAESVIAVGAYTNKTTWPVNGNQKGSYGYNIGTPGGIAYFSSYGTTFDGRALPHITAPGMGMISSMSNYYYADLSESDPDYKYMVFSIDEGTKRKRSSYWVEMSGTSMAAPFVTGVVALWLEANPDLTAEEAKKIMMETATKDNFTNIEPKRWGAGKINALAGLKKVIGVSSGIHDVATDGRDILINRVGANDYDLFCAGASEIRAELFNIAGQLVASDVTKGDNLTFTPAADNGIYILRVTAGNKTATQKVTIR